MFTLTHPIDRPKEDTLFSFPKNYGSSEMEYLPSLHGNGQIWAVIRATCAGLRDNTSATKMVSTDGGCSQFASGLALDYLDESPLYGPITFGNTVIIRVGYNDMAFLSNPRGQISTAEAEFVTTSSLNNE